MNFLFLDCTFNINSGSNTLLIFSIPALIPLKHINQFTNHKIAIPINIGKTICPKSKGDDDDLKNSL